MSYEQATENEQPNITPEIVSIADTPGGASPGTGLSDNEFFNKIAIRGFMLLHVSVFAESLRAYMEGVL
ncbi:MAG: hypothetical protein KAR80_08830 [Rhodospirillaceae bacterium]|nr:hypothetical protein [Rhodospirillaceae bacterium]